MFVVRLASRLPIQIVEETVTYGWPQGTSPYLVVTIYSKCPPCLNFAVYTGYMLPRRLRRLDVLLLRINNFVRSVVDGVCVSVRNGRDQHYTVSFPRFKLHTGYVNGMRAPRVFRGGGGPERATRTQRFGSSHSDQHKLKTVPAPVCGTLARPWTTIGQLCPLDPRTIPSSPGMSK